MKHRHQKPLPIFSLFGKDNRDGSSVRPRGGPVMANVYVKAIFWGSRWFHPLTPSAAEVLWAIRSIFFGPYMSGLGQYGVGNGVLDPNPRFEGLFVDPPNPFSGDDIEGMLASLIDQGQIPDAPTNHQLLCCVFTPPDVKSVKKEDAGYHGVMSYKSRIFPFAWIGNTSVLEFVTGVFSHELAESATDPFLDAFKGDDGTCGQTGGCEIADYCYGGDSGGGGGSLGGIDVSAYWSSRDGRCFLPKERSVPGNVSGNPALIQGRFRPRGNFELVTPLSTGGLAHYSRLNDDRALPWFGPEIFGADVGKFDAVSMIQSNFTAGAYIGNLEVVTLFEREALYYWREDIPPYTWHGPVPMNGFQQREFIGNPALIQGRFARVGNFELVIPLASGGIAHYSRANDIPGAPWFGPNIFGADVGRFDAVTLIQSDMSFVNGSGVGNLEVVARFGGSLLYYTREDAPPYRWFGPFVIPLSAPGENSRLAAGCPSLVESRFGPFLRGYFQLVTPLADGGLAHYTRDNQPFGMLKWHGPTVFTLNVGQVNAVSLIQSNFSSTNTGIGNLELVAQVRNQLLHYWREDNMQIATPGDLPWYGPWVVTAG